MITIEKKSLAGYSFIDLFAGLGGFRIALESLGAKCVYSNEWNVPVQKVYADNFGDIPEGDITQVDENTIPDHDILCAGFPCEAFSIRSKSYERMAALFKRAEGAWRQKKRGYTYTAVGCLYEIFGLLYEESVYVPNKQLEKIQLGIDYINEHFTEDFEVDRLSDMCKISHTYFKKIFNNAYNMPPKAYITQLRIRYACDLLKSGKYKIGDIAEEVGYKNVYYFSKVFKAQTGSTPSEYKKNVDDGGTK